MLRARVLTALVLAPLLLALIVYAPLPLFALVIGIVAVIGALEWVPLAGVPGTGSAVCGAVLAATLCAALWFVPSLGVPLLIGVCIWWALALVCVASFPKRTGWDRPHVLLPSGLLVISTAWLGIVDLRADRRGAFVLVFLLFVVWFADIGAYFAGRAFGRRKLAPAVSPGKTWEGALGGTILAIIAGLVMSRWTPATGNLSSLSVVIACIAIVFVSVLGDLTESMLKRQRGVKDSGTLLPGHGGVLDRIDSLLSTAPLWALWTIGS